MAGIFIKGHFERILYFVNHKPVNIFVLKMSSLTSSANTQVHLRLDFIMEANNMNPDQTAALEQSDLGPYCLPNRQYRLPKKISR